MPALQQLPPRPVLSETDLGRIVLGRLAEPHELGERLPPLAALQFSGGPKAGDVKAAQSS